MTDRAARTWMAFVDPTTPRVLMVGQQMPDAMHWSSMTLDSERSTERVKVWLDDHGAPVLIDAQGGIDVRELEAEINERAFSDGAVTVGSHTLDVMSLNGWVWWDAGPTESLEDDGFEEALERVRRNAEVNRRRLR